MTEIKNLNKPYTYNKHNSFFSFSSINKKFNESEIIKRINILYDNKVGLNNVKKNDIDILDAVIKDLNLEKNKKNKNNFSLSRNVVDEILSFQENKILRYLVFRYKYEIFPIKKKLDNFPPYL